MDNKLFVIYGDHPLEMTEAILDIVKLADKIPDGARVGIKPNLVVAKPASEGATTHPEIVEGLIKYLRANGINDIKILEGGRVGDDLSRAFEVCGFKDLSESYGVPLVDLQKDEYLVKQANEMSIEIAGSLEQIDYLISLPVLKGHCQTKLSCALKNLKGCISDEEKKRFHSLGLHKPIALLNTVLKADFVLADGICGDVSFEEGGNPFEMHRLFCGTDSVLLDAYAATLLGYKPEEIEYIGLSAALGVGCDDLSSAEVVEINSGFVPMIYRETRSEKPFMKRVRDDQACSVCYANLMQALRILDEEGHSEFLPPEVFLGKGLIDQEYWSVGVGSCTGSFGEYLPGCPPSTVEIKDFLMGYVRRNRRKLGK
ncbi:MAG: DUF362 domain-containing protein [Clostridia bacterium]|nr:DUF362 domain-containing protein [Clostridia bacterium]